MLCKKTAICVFPKPHCANVTELYAATGNSILFDTAASLELCPVMTRVYTGVYSIVDQPCILFRFVSIDNVLGALSEVQLSKHVYADYHIQSQVNCS